MKRSPRVVPALIGGALLLLVGGAGLILAASGRGSLPPEKQALEDFARFHRLHAAPADKAADPGPPAIAPDAWVPETGMLGQVNAPVSGNVFSTVNAWAGWLSPTTYVIVHAGGPADDSSAGAVFVERIPGANGRIGTAGEPLRWIVRAPGAGGTLRIVRFEDGVLIVANPGGRELRFRPLSATFE